jgi:preprotein translocase subunit SecG
MQTLITVIHVITCILLILVVLLQSGRGGGLSSTFGGASAAVFGGRGAGDFMTRVTSGAAMVFFVTSFTLATLSSRQRSAVERALESTKPAATDTTTAPDAAGEPKDTDIEKGAAETQATPTPTEGTKAPVQDPSPAGNTPEPPVTH